MVLPLVSLLSGTCGKKIILLLGASMSSGVEQGWYVVGRGTCDNIKMLLLDVLKDCFFLLHLCLISFISNRFGKIRLISQR